MHCESVAVGYAGYNVVENKSATLGGDLDLNYLAVGNAVLLSVGGGHMYMTLSGDNAFGKLDLACRTDKLASA